MKPHITFGGAMRPSMRLRRPKYPPVLECRPAPWWVRVGRVIGSFAFRIKHAMSLRRMNKRFPGTAPKGPTPF